MLYFYAIKVNELQASHNQQFSSSLVLGSMVKQNENDERHNDEVII